MAIHRIRDTRSSWGVWIWWMLASIAAVVAYVAVMSLLMPIVTFFAGDGSRQAAESAAGPGMLIGVISAGAIGAMVGFAQWLVLRRVVPGTGWWVLATTAGYAALFGARFIGSLQESGWWAGIAAFLLTGATLGILQWLVLRGRIAHAGLWIVISIGGWALALAITGLAVVSGLYVEPLDMLAAFLVPVAAAGAGLVWLLQSPPAGLPPGARHREASS